jgi:hypothetical protein
LVLICTVQGKKKVLNLLAVFVLSITSLSTFKGWLCFVLCLLFRLMNNLYALGPSVLQSIPLINLFHIAFLERVICFFIIAHFLLQLITSLLFCSLSLPSDFSTISCAWSHFFGLSILWSKTAYTCAFSLLV